MTMTTTCETCGFVLPAPAPHQRCPRCGGQTRTDAVIHASAATAVGSAGAATIVAKSRYARAWYEDALREARNGPTGDFQARRREIVFAVCCAESYIFEWTADLLGAKGRPDADVDRYFPPHSRQDRNCGLRECSRMAARALLRLTRQPRDRIDRLIAPQPRPARRRRPSDRWNWVPRLLREDRLIPNRPDLGGQHGADWRRLVEFRNGLVHSAISRPEISGPTGIVRPKVTTGDLAALSAGWATRVVTTRIRSLHIAAETAPPDWLRDP